MGAWVAVSTIHRCESAKAVGIIDNSAGVIGAQIIIVAMRTILTIACLWVAYIISTWSAITAILWNVNTDAGRTAEIQCAKESIYTTAVCSKYATSCRRITGIICAGATIVTNYSSVCATGSLIASIGSTSIIIVAVD